MSYRRGDNRRPNLRDNRRLPLDAAQRPVHEDARLEIERVLLDFQVPNQRILSHSLLRDTVVTYV